MDLLIAFCCLTVVIIIALVYLLYRFNKNKQRSHRVLLEQNTEIKNQKQHLEEVIQRLKLAQSQLVQSEKMASLGQLTAGVAHEINNPVNFIYTGIAGLKKNLNALMKIVEKYDELEKTKDVKNTLQTVLQLKLDLRYEEILSDINGLMESIEDGAKRTSKIVKSLGIFTRIDVQELNMIDIHQNLNSSLLLLKFKLQDSIEVEKHYASTLPRIESYNGQLNQLFMNILTNAIQAIGKQSGKISIATEDKGDNILISIADTGEGIAAENIKDLFNPFYTTKRIGEGTGLGLSISHSIIQRHKGKIEVDSQKGVGTKMMITIPKRQSAVGSNQSAVQVNLHNNSQ